MDSVQGGVSLAAMLSAVFFERDACLLALPTSLCGETCQLLEILPTVPGSFVQFFRSPGVCLSGHMPHGE